MTAYFVQQLDALHRRSLRMASLVEDIVQEACEAAFDGDSALSERVIRRDSEVDSEEVEIEAETVRIMALHQPVGADLRLLFTILKVNNDLERVADCAVNVAERAAHLKEGVTGVQGERLRQMAALVRKMLRAAIQAYGAQDAEIGRQLFIDDDDVDVMYSDVIKGVVDEASRQPDLLAGRLDLLSVAKNLERIADHATNIAEDTVFLSTGEIVRHQDHL
ncbi:MAG: phosphate signaling complex protein PhoU [Planctomycetota bacterium]